MLKKSTWSLVFDKQKQEVIKYDLFSKFLLILYKEQFPLWRESENIYWNPNKSEGNYSLVKTKKHLTMYIFQKM